eukprot:comp18374_c0_seq1/m.32720 comp18374_c0_seq1/g.32720  ORF comp18374_c0_seq1/g.32720 comp18374_c0_seq1/m.32720 type:complete len:249 (+) comp18374_c0_seq1:3-749(+)
MARRYDSRTTVFNPEGRLFQVEYALKAIDHAGAAVGLLSRDGIVLGAERKVSSKLLEINASEKLAAIDDHMACCLAGITADANILVEYLRGEAQKYRGVYDEPMPIEMLLNIVCDMKQYYTQIGGLRPFGVSLLYAGWDVVHGFQLYQSDPSGNYNGWKATAIGSNNAQAQSILKQEYKENMIIEDTLKLALKVLHKTMDSTAMTSEKVDFATLTRDNDGKIRYTVLSKEKIDALIKDTDFSTTASSE